MFVHGSPLSQGNQHSDLMAQGEDLDILVVVAH